MPIRTRRIRRMKRRKLRKFRGKALTIGRSVITSGVSDQQVVKLRYSDTINIPSSGIAVGTHLFKGNSIFDPDETGGGHQPLARDQWATFYNNYMVLGCSYKITFSGAAQTNGAQVAVVIKPTNASSVNFSVIREKPYVKAALISGKNGGRDIKTLSGYMSSKKIFGVRKLTTADTEYTAAMDSNPSRIWYIHLHCQDQDEVSSYTVKAIVDLTYYVRLFSRVPLSQS